MALRELALFAGAGGGILGGHLLGWRTVCAVELEDYPRRVLFARQRDGMLPRFSIWDDVTTFDGRPWRGSVDVISGGFPCQNISQAGSGGGIGGSKSGLWFEMARIISEVQPRHVFVENSPLLRTRGLERVLDNLAEMGYDAAWGIVGAHNAGLPQKRDRMWIRAILSDAMCNGCESNQGRKSVPDENGNGSSHARGRQELKQRSFRASDFWVRGWRDLESGMDRTTHDVADWMDRIKAIGNGQVPAVAAIAWNALGDILNERGDMS